MQLEAGERALKGEEAAAAKLFFLSQGVTFQVGQSPGGRVPNLNSLQHLVLIQKYKQNSAVDASDAAKQKTRIEEGSAMPATKEEDDEEKEEKDTYIEKDGLKFANFQATDVVKMLEELPASWTVVQISVNCAVDPALTRFNLKKLSLV